MRDQAGPAPESGVTGPDRTAAGLARTANDYDSLPYPSMPMAYTQPAHLAALVTLFGLHPPPVEHARVLELGCAAGGNIIPLAARFPGAAFLGVDLSQRHVDDGRARIAQAGLSNVTLQQGDLTVLDLGDARFDYIICHGVFSWVPKPVQDAIFRLCHDYLTPHGMAAISYNVLPGWHSRMAIRDICLHYAGSEGTPRQRTARARAALEHIAESSDPAEPYGLMMRKEAARLKSVPASYILGEFLAPANTAFHVRDFIRRAQQHQLGFLCETDLMAAVPPTLKPAIRDRLTSFANPDRSIAEQDIDYITGRLFRRSILVRQPDAGTWRGPSPERLGTLHAASPVRLDPAQSTDQAAVFVDARARPVTVADPVIRRVFQRLSDAYPATVSLEDLSNAAGEDPAMKARVERAIFTMVMSGRASISVLPLVVGSASRPCPKAWAFARLEAASIQPWITSLNHAGVGATPVLRTLVPYLDGTHDRAALRARLIEAFENGTLPVPETPPGQESLDKAGLNAIAEGYVEESITYLARRALLEP
jgi:SAM-dependent methyltransferase/methyltransferase-like protein